MTAAPIPSPTRSRQGRPLEVARAGLQRQLDPRYVQFPSFAHQAGSEPLVVPLGAADLLGDVVADPYAMVRSRATVHLTGRKVLVGPWGGDGTRGDGTRGERSRGAGCGLCLGLYWQRLRSGPEPNARAWGHDALGRQEQPVLTPYAVDVVRGVWTAVFGGRDPGTPPVEVPGVPATSGEGPARVTCVDLRVPVPRTYPILPEPPCGLHTGCRG